MKLRPIYTRPWSYMVCETDRTQRPVLCVLAGGVAMYHLVLELTEDEMDTFRRQGHLDGLALDVARHASKYADRLLSADGPLEFEEEG